MSTAAQLEADRVASITAADSAERAALAVAEQAAVAAREQGRATRAAAEAAKAAGLKTNADAFAVDFFAAVVPIMTAWRASTSREHAAKLIAQLQRFGGRSLADLGQPIRNSLPAIAMAASFAEEEPNLRAVFGARDFFLGDFANQQLGETAGALIKAKSAIVAEQALRQLELALTLRVEASTPVAPTSKELAVWAAQLASGRESDLTERLRAVHADSAHDVADFDVELDVVEPTSRDAEPEQSDDDFDAETEALARLAEQQTHFDRLAGEQNAPRAVQSRE
jgi:hypothetical protein